MSTEMTDPRYNSDLALKTIEYDRSQAYPIANARLTKPHGRFEVVYQLPMSCKSTLTTSIATGCFQSTLHHEQVRGIYNYTEKPSKSGEPGKMHITSCSKTVRSPPRAHRATSHAGSDRVRELLSYVQYLNGDAHPTLFLEKTAPKQLTRACRVASGIAVIHWRNCDGNPSVTESQVALMREVTFDPECSVFSVHQQTYRHSTGFLQSARSAADAAHLANLGFLKDISADHKEQLEQMKIASERTWTCYQITAMAERCFRLRRMRTQLMAGLQLLIILWLALVGLWKTLNLLAR